MELKQYDYSKTAEYYDNIDVDEGQSPRSSEFLAKIFKKHGVKTVLDMTCGTGAQTIGLTKMGYKVTASDIDTGMLKVAKRKAKGLNIEFHQGDMKTAKYGKFDAVIAMFNAIGHLSKREFEKAMRNVAENLNKDGLFLFDIFNLEFMKAGNFRDYKHIDRAKEFEDIKFVRFSDNTLDSERGIMHINQEVYWQETFKKYKKYKEKWDMQIYSADELKEMLERNGFETLEIYGGDDEPFDKKKSLYVYIVARKK